MKAISVNVSTQAYAELKSLAAQRGRPVAELIRQAMDEYLASQRRQAGRSFHEIRPHDGGRELQQGWTRSELLDEMLER